MLDYRAIIHAIAAAGLPRGVAVPSPTLRRLAAWFFSQRFDMAGFAISVPKSVAIEGEALAGLSPETIRDKIGSSTARTLDYASAIEAASYPALFLWRVAAFCPRTIFAPERPDLGRVRAYDWTEADSEAAWTLCQIEAAKDQHRERASRSWHTKHGSGERLAILEGLTLQKYEDCIAFASGEARSDTGGEDAVG